MVFVRRNNGTIFETSFADLTGERREDGKFHVKLKDGSEGVVIHKDELEAEPKAEDLQRFIDNLEEEKDKRGGLQRLMEDGLD
jgi:hypothetical protein